MATRLIQMWSRAIGPGEKEREVAEVGDTEQREYAQVGVLEFQGPLDVCSWSSPELSSFI